MHRNIILKLALVCAMPIAGLACPGLDDTYLVLKLGSEEPPRDEGLGVVFFVHAHGGGAVTLDAVNGEFVHPSTGEVTDELCLTVGGGAMAIRLQPTPGVEGARVLAYLWKESPGDAADCADVSTLVMSNSLLFDPEDTAVTETSSDSDTGNTETDTDSTETDTGSTETDTGNTETDTGNTDTGTGP